MRLFTVLVEELESRPDDADRVAALARHLRAVGRDAGAIVGQWLVAGARPQRPPRLTQAALADAAARLAADAGMSPWLFDAGRDASAEAAEAIALLLPWPEPTAEASRDERRRPTLAAWLSAWQAAAASPAARRAMAVAATIAELDDAGSRRWAVRAACGLARPLVTAWQWQRAWALAFDADAHAMAWAWHRHGTLHPVPADAPFALAPPRSASLPAPPDEHHAGLLAAWRDGAWWAEPRWRGLRVRIVRQGADVAVWRCDGSLLNAVLPEAWLVATQWPDECVIEGVLVAWLVGHGFDMPAMPASTSPRRRSTTEAGAATAATLHLVLTDWHRWDDDDARAVAAHDRRARLHAHWPAWPARDGQRVALDDGDAPRGLAPPAIFTTPMLDELARDDSRALAAIATSTRERGWSGVVLRRRHGSRDDGGEQDAWAVRASPQRVRAVLQYVPADALGAASAAALAVVECGFALWSRAPLSEEEQRAAMTAAMSGEFLPPPAEAPGLAGLRLLPLARVAIALPDDEVAAIHAWLRANVGQRFGALHAVAPVLVFELDFAAARPSRRHRIGLALDRPRVRRWLRDAAPGGAHRVEDLGAALSRDTEAGTNVGEDGDDGLR